MMRELYSEQDLQNIQGQLKKRGIIMLIVSILFIGLLVATLLSDNHFNTIGAALIAGGWHLWFLSD